MEFDTNKMLSSVQGIVQRIGSEKNLIPALLSGGTFGALTYVVLTGKTIRKARDIVDDVITGMAGKAITALMGDGQALAAIGMFVPAYAEVGNMIADAVIPIPAGGTEESVIASGDVLIAALAITVISALAMLVLAPEGEGPISARLHTGLFGDN